MSETDLELFNDDPMQEYRDAETALFEIMRATEQRERETRSKLESLRSEYSRLLIDLEMNRSKDIDRKFEMRTEIRALEAELSDFPVLQEGFTREKAALVAVENKGRAIIRDRRAYSEIKNQIAEKGPGLSLVSDLRMWAEKLDCLEDAEVFLATLKGHAA